MSLEVGPAITYVGGVSAAVGGQAAQAKPVISPETINLLATPLPIPSIEVTLGDVLTIVALCVTIARFRWDVKREKRRNGSS
ncbi:MAG: hypothetical protein ACRCXB_22820 [Aeromonadaceae bacterium]